MALPEASSGLSGAKARVVTGRAWPSRRAVRRPVEASQRRMAPSLPPAAIHRPSALQATALRPPGSSSSKIFSPLVTSQTRTPCPGQRLARRRASLLTARVVRGSVPRPVIPGPIDSRGVASSAAVPGRQRCTMRSLPPNASSWPSLLNARQRTSPSSPAELPRWRCEARSHRWRAWLESAQARRDPSAVRARVTTSLA